MTLKDSFEDLLGDAIDASEGNIDAQIRLEKKLSSLNELTKKGAETAIKQNNKG